MSEEKLDKNRKYVAEQREKVAIKVVTKSPDGFDDQLEKLVPNVFGRFCDAFDELLSTKEVEAILRQRDPTMPVTGLSSSLSKLPNRDSPVTIRKENQVTAEDLTELLSGVSGEEGNVPYIPSLECIDSKVNIYLEDGIHAIDRDSYRHYKRIKSFNTGELGSPTEPIFSFKLGYAPGDLSRNYDGAVFLYWIYTPIDIWFGDSTIERINKARLHECFDRLDQELTIVDSYAIDTIVGVDSNDVEAVFQYDGPPSEDLIEQYRREWVESTLRNQAVGEVIDGEKIVDFGKIGEPVVPEEVKARIETYIRHSESTSSVDCVRVTMQDDQKFEGRITDDKVAWD